MKKFRNIFDDWWSDPLSALGVLGGNKTAPTVTAFTVNSPSSTLAIPIAVFTASEANVSFLITENSTSPDVNDAGWSATAQATHTVAASGAYTLYPWVKDAAGNVSSVYGSPASVEVTTLLAGLKGYWKAADLTDSSGLGHTFTPGAGAAAPTFGAGKIGNCTIFARASGQYANIANHADFQTGNVDFTWQGWVWLTTLNANETIVSKGDFSTSKREWSLAINGSNNRFSFFISANGSSASVSVVADNYGIPVTGVWILVKVWHDAANDQIGIRVNNGTANVAATGGVYPAAGTGPLTIGGEAGLTRFLDGKLDEFGFWKRLLTSGEDDALYNSGFGLTYPFASSGITPTDWYIVAGQSNAEGNLTNAQSYTGANPAWMYRADFILAALADPTDSNAAGTGNSLWPLVGTLISNNANKSTGFITTGQDGTGLGPGDPDWQKGNATYTACITQVKKSGTRPKGVLWVQGEHEPSIGTTQAQYQTALSQMLDDMQADLDLPSLKLICSQTGQAGTSDINPTRLAQQNRWINDADILPGPLTYDFDLSAGGGDGVHVKTNAHALKFAQRFWRCISAAFYGGTESARGPQVQSATISGNVVTVTFTGGQGNLANQTDKTGWKFTDDGSVIAVSSTAANGTHAVDVTLASTPTGTKLISFGSQQDAKGATLCDSGTYPQPPEPFVDFAVT